MKYGLIGEKLIHSFSKEVHNKIGSYDYELKEISKNQLEEFILSKDFLGINVTIPYKESVIKYLDEISPSAKKIGAVNTIVNKNGKLIGYNTDYDGAKLLIEKSGAIIKDKNVFVLGSGGASKTLVAVTSDLGAKSVKVVSRSGNLGITYEQLYKSAEDAQIIINATPVGTYLDASSCPIDINKFSKLEGVIDLIYNPLRTRLVLESKGKSINAIGGLYMLVAQAVYAYSYFFDKDVKGELIDKIYGEILTEKQNVVLTGMPSCGKSTVGEVLSKKINKKLVDIDEQITKEYGKSPKEIILLDGEEKFRDIESKMIETISYETGLVISTGGGAILKKENVGNLKRNGKIFYLKRSLERLLVTENRPLTSSKKSLEEVFNKRKTIYETTSDCVIDTDQMTVEEVAEKIKELL